MSETKTDSQLLEEIASNQGMTLREAKEAVRLSAEVKAETQAFEKKWTTIQDDVVKQGATLTEIKDELKEIKAKAGRIRTIENSSEKRTIWIGDKIAETINEVKAKIPILGLKDEGVYIMGTEPSNEIERKASVIQSSSLSGTGNNYTTYIDWQPGMEPLGQDRFRAFVRTIQSETDFVRFQRANAPVGAGSFS